MCNITMFGCLKYFSGKLDTLSDLCSLGQPIPTENLKVRPQFLSSPNTFEITEHSNDQATARFKCLDSAYQTHKQDNLIWSRML